LHRFIVDVGWVKWQFEGPALPMVQRSAEWFRGEREALPPVLIRSTAEVS
jgi:hypothetical protein